MVHAFWKSNPFVGGRDARDFNLKFIFPAHINNSEYRSDLNVSSFDDFQISEYSETIKIHTDRAICPAVLRVCRLYFYMRW